jgi:ribosomal protein S12 methylthiotransferase accessory factor YcaO
MTRLATADAIDAYSAYLKPGAELVQLFAIDGLDRMGIAVCNATAWGEHSAQGIGYGDTPEQAMLGALGEATEGLAAARYATAAHVRELTVAQAAREGGVHPARLSLVTGTELDDHARLLWVPARTWPGDEPRLLPLEAVTTSTSEFQRAAAAFGAREPLFPPITNGLGAAAFGDREWAVRHGVHELLQRDLNWSQFKALDTGRSVDPRCVALDLAQRAEVAGLQLRLKYAGSTLGVHSLHCSAVDVEGSTPAVARTATGEGADPDPLAAGRKAILELCASRCRKHFFFGGEAALVIAPAAYRERARKITRSHDRELSWDLAARFDDLLGDPVALDGVIKRITHVSELVDLPAASPGDGLAGALQNEGLEAIVADLTADEEPVHVVKVVVPGLEAEVLSHHRLSERGVARLAERCPRLVARGAAAPGPGWQRAVTQDAEAWIDVAAMEHLTAPFLPLYREPGRHAYTIP